MQTISNEQLLPYMKNRYKNSIFKILPMYEECSKTLIEYIDSMIVETDGLIKMLPNQYLLVPVKAILVSLTEEVTHQDKRSLVKREVFKMLDLVGKVIESSEVGGV